MDVGGDVGEGEDEHVLKHPFSQFRQQGVVPTTFELFLFVRAARDCEKGVWAILYRCAEAEFIRVVDVRTHTNPDPSHTPTTSTSAVGW